MEAERIFIEGNLTKVKKASPTPRPASGRSGPTILSKDAQSWRTLLSYLEQLQNPKAVCSYTRCGREWQALDKTLGGACEMCYMAKTGMGKCLSEHFTCADCQKAPALKSLDELKVWADQDKIATSQWCYGRILEDGLWIQKNLHLAFDYYKQSAEQKNPWGLYYLGRCYQEGLGCKRDLQTALETFKLAAEQDHPPAQYSLSFFYRNGLAHVKQDKQEALRLLIKSAAKLYPPAMESLAVQREDKTNLRLLDEAAKGSEGSSEALHKLGFFFELQALGAQAVEFYIAAAKDYAPAQHDLGLCYWRGIGIVQDRAVAVEHFKGAADKGYAKAQVSLGRAYEQGFCAPDSGTKEEAAFKCYEQAANQGDAVAQYMLGCCYEKGTGLWMTNFGKALELYKQAAKQDYPEAVFKLGECYELGVGVGVDQGKAASEYRRAAALGHSGAQKMLLFRELTELADRLSGPPSLRT